MRAFKISEYVNMNFESSQTATFFVGAVFMLLKICRKCGKQLPQNARCPCRNERHKIYNDHRRDKEKNTFYHSAQWTATVAKVKARANGLDEYLLAQGYLEQGTVVHHIYTIDERPDLKLSVDNLILVSARTHNRIHATYTENQEKKKELQMMLSEIIRRTN